MTALLILKDILYPRFSLTSGLAVLRLLIYLLSGFLHFLVTFLTGLVSNVSLSFQTKHLRPNHAGVEFKLPLKTKKPSKQGHVTVSQ